MGMLSVKDFHLEYTLTSGQLFRVSKIGDWHYIVTGNTLFKVQQRNDHLLFENIAEKELKKLFSLDKNYAEILKEIDKDTFMHELIQRYRGLRVVNMDPWECTVSFICASFSNIKKIRLVLDNLAQAHGKQLKLDEVTAWSFPEFKTLTDLKKLKKANAGFRARYLHSTNHKLTPTFFEELRTLPYHEAKQRMMYLDGIGGKVADCILLFSLGFTEAFPVDVWIKRIVEQQYLHTETPEKKIAEFGRNHFGRYAGIAQQYLYFHALRNKTLFSK